MKLYCISIIRGVKVNSSKPLLTTETITLNMEKNVLTKRVQKNSTFWFLFSIVVKTRLQTLNKGKGEKTYNGIMDCFR